MRYALSIPILAFVSLLSGQSLAAGAAGAARRKGRPMVLRACGLRGLRVPLVLSPLTQAFASLMWPR